MKKSMRIMIGQEKWEKEYMSRACVHRVLYAYACWGMHPYELMNTNTYV